MNKQAQLDFPLITFLVIIATLLVLSPILLNIVNSTLTPMANNFANMTGTPGAARAATTINSIHGTFVNFWDYVILIAFLIQILLMFIAAFMIDTHPVWIVIYIILAFFTFLFAPGVFQTVSIIWTPTGAGGSFGTEVAQMGFMNFIQTYFGIILVLVYVLTGVIMYAKFKFLGGQ